LLVGDKRAVWRPWEDAATSLSAGPGESAGARTATLGRVDEETDPDPVTTQSGTSPHVARRPTCLSP